MAIFASANSTGYGDPIKALSIKALEQRQKDMLAQQAGQQFDAASMATIPGGIGHVLGIVGDNMRQGQTDAALASNRAALAQAMTGYDAAKGMTPETRGVLARVAPEILDKLLTHEQETRQLATTEGGLNQRNAATIAGQAANVAAQEAGAGARTHETVTGHSADVATQETGAGTRQQQKIEAEKAQAAEAAKTQEALAQANENRVQARPTDEPLVTLRRALDRGEISKEEYDARAKQLTGPKTGEQNIINAQGEKSIEAQSLLHTLDTAYDLTDTSKGGKGIHSGPMAGMTQGIGENLPGFVTGAVPGITPDPEVTKNTQRYNQIMGTEVLAAVNAMKGSSSNADVQLNMKIANDANSSIEAKRDAINVLRTKLPAIIELHNKAIEAAGGEAPKLPAAPVTIGKPKSTAADPAVGAGADPARAAAADPAAASKVVEGITEAQAKALPAGTRFKLIDGRTGTAR